MHLLDSSNIEYLDHIFYDAMQILIEKCLYKAFRMDSHKIHWLDNSQYVNLEPKRFGKLFRLQ